MRRWDRRRKQEVAGHPPALSRMVSPVGIGWWKFRSPSDEHDQGDDAEGGECCYEPDHPSEDIRSTASIPRYSRELVPTSQAARHILQDVQDHRAVCHSIGW